MGLVGLLVAGLAAVAFLLLRGDSASPGRNGGAAAGRQSQEPAATRTADDQADTAIGEHADTSASQPKASDGSRADSGNGTTSEELAPSAADLPSQGLGAGHVGRQGVLEVTTEDADAPGQDLPDNYSSARNPVGGYAVGVPTVYKAYTVGPTTFVESNDTMIEANFEVHSYESVDPWVRLTQDEKLFAKEHAEDQYKKLKTSRRWTYRGKPAVMWEFTWTRNGERTHGRQIAFRDGPRTYTVLYRSSDTWWLSGGSQFIPPDFEQAFTPLSQ
ncbi:hypothetical protein AB0368_25895 [Actinoplanes sp. NPDC051475]|uniref:hypothetical protein n=1 Tax=Actinoplanes sp. NPDC051475 TaxID=3157225 RepID=UPI00344D7108